MGDWKDILSDSEEPISEEDLLKYLEQKTLNSADTYTQELIDGSFEQDATEGLQQLGSSEKVKKQVSFLNKELRVQLKLKKRTTSKTDLSNFKWIIVTLLILLFICVMGYILVRMNSANSNKNQSSLNRSEKIESRLK